MTQPLHKPGFDAPGDQPSALLPAHPAPLQLARRWGYRQSLMLVLLLATWMFARPWAGLWHDGQLYAVQALQRLNPGTFRNDLFFMFGSQDSFTIFSPLYAACIKAFGLEAGAHLLHSVGAALWLGAAFFLLGAFLRGAPLWLAVACLLLLPTDYDPIRGIGLAEPFLTPRIFAEALCMLSIGCVVRGKGRWAPPLLLLSLVLHPLLSLGAVLFTVLYMGRGRAWLLALAGAAAVLACAAAGVTPFDRILRTMDPEWFRHVAQISSMVTWDAWRAEDNILGRTLVSASLVLAAAWLSAGWRSRFYYCIALTGALGLAASWLGTGVLHNVLLLQIQPWRTLWLLQLTSMLAMVWLWAACWRRGRVFRCILLALTAGVLLRDSFGGLIAASAAAALCWQDSRPAAAELPDRFYRILLAGVGVLFLAWLMEVDRQSLLQRPPIAWSYGVRGSDLEIWLWTLVQLGGGAMLGIAVYLCAWHWAGRPQRAVRLAAGTLAAACLAAVVLFTWGYTFRPCKVSAPTRQVLQAEFVPLIPPHATVYWQNDVRVPWYVLGRPSYVSMPQLFGLVFSRDTAIEGMRRLQRLQAIGIADSFFGMVSKDIPVLPEPSLSGLDYVCGDPALDFIVLQKRLGSAAVAHVSDQKFELDYYLYDCAQQRRSHAAN